MRNNLRNNSRTVNGFISLLVAEKKKAMLALCLIVLMIFMWLKVLTRTSPKVADANLIAELIEEQNQFEPKIKISFVELPDVAGRNDLISRDFFASNGWHTFIDDQGRKSIGIEEINIVSKDDDKEVMQKVAQNLKLEAIVSSEEPLAFINDKVLRAGDKLFVSDGIKSYECEVVEIAIKENIVVMKCRESKITLRLTKVN
jgi:hypothetical protein